MRYILPFIFIAAFSACQSPSTEQAGGGSDSTLLAADTALQQKRETLSRKFYYTIGELTPPMELLHLLKSNEIPFNADILNPASNEQRYTSGFKKAVNYGVYGIDLAYASFYGEKQDLINYYLTTRKLSERLGVQSSFERFTASFQSNTDNTDSLLAMIDRAYAETHAYLLSNHRLEVASHMLSGSIIEAQYIAFNVMKDFPQRESNSGLFQVLAEQPRHLDNLVALLEEMKDVKSSADLIGQLKALQGSWSVVKSAGDLTPETMQSLLAACGKVREHLVR